MKKYNQQEITLQLLAWGDGNKLALESLLPPVKEQLRRQNSGERRPGRARVKTIRISRRTMPWIWRWRWRLARRWLYRALNQGAADVA